MARRSSTRLTFVVLASGVGSFSLLQSMTVPTLPTIQAEFGTDQATAAWVITAFLLSASVATPILGRLGDAHGKQRMFVLSLALLAPGSLIAAFAPSIEVLIAARVVQGAGSGAIPLAFGIARDEFRAERVPTAIGFLSSLLAVGFGVGILVGGPIVTVLGYPWLFLLPALAATVAATAAWRGVPPSPVRSDARLRLLPAFLLSGWLVALLLGLSKAPAWGWASWPALALLGSAATLLVAWLLVEVRIDVPLVDLRMMRLRGVWTANLVALLTGVSMYGSFAFVPQFVQTPSVNGYGFDVSASESGLIMLPAAVMSFLCGLVAARVTRRIGARNALVLGSAISTAGLCVAAFAHAEAREMYAAVALTGLGTGLVFACLANAVIEAVPAHQTGTASGMNANIRIIGGAIGMAVITTVVTAAPQASGYPTEGAYTLAFALMAAASLVAALAALLVPRVRRATASPATAAALRTPVSA